MGKCRQYLVSGPYMLSQTRHWLNIHMQIHYKQGILISLVQGLGLGFTYGLAICSCALQLWVGRFLVTDHKAHAGEIVTTLFAVILSGLGLNQEATNFYSSDQGRIAAYRLFEMITRSSSTVGKVGMSLFEEQNIKLSIARVVLLNPTVLMLDEVTGGLDFEAEKAVQEALDLLMLARSTIIIARHLSLIKNADYIAVMEEGQLVEMGTHDELMTLDGLYAELLKCEEASKLQRGMPVKNYKDAFQVEKDSSANHSFQELSSPRMAKSPSLQRSHGVLRPPDGTYSSHESPKVHSPP
ncbi:ABC transporter B family member 20 [Linum perenne]